MAEHPMRVAFADDDGAVYPAAPHLLHTHADPRRTARATQPVARCTAPWPAIASAADARPRLSVGRACFDDFGLLARQLRCAKVTATQLSGGKLAIDHAWLEAEGLMLSHLKFNQAAIIQTVSEPGWYLLVANRSPRRWCGIELPADSLVVVPPGRKSLSIFGAPAELVAIPVRRDVLAGWEAPLAALLNWDYGPEQSILAADPAGIGKLVQWVAGLTRPSTGAPDPALWDQLRALLLAAINHRATPAPVSPAQRVARYDLALMALRLVDRERDGRCTVRELARAIGVSTRSLEYAFMSALGVSPTRYMLAHRLNRARSVLRTQGGSGGTVTEIALDYQFEHFGRFAQQYARLFGERPSDTLRAARMAAGRAIPQVSLDAGRTRLVKNAAI